MSIGSNLRRKRKEHGLTQAQLAEKAGISRSYYADIEKDYYNPSLDTLKSIAAVLLTTSSVLLEDASVLGALLDGQDGMDAARSTLEKNRADKTQMGEKGNDKWGNLFNATHEAAPDDEKRLVGLYRQLNKDGQEKLLETADDMVQSDKYILTSAGSQKRDGEKMA
ncbi:MAG: helix-turn-helix transcriptional regulator [Oscillospiraceae bacterium]